MLEDALGYIDGYGFSDRLGSFCCTGCGGFSGFYTSCGCGTGNGKGSGGGPMDWDIFVYCGD